MTVTTPKKIVRLQFRFCHVQRAGWKLCSAKFLKADGSLIGFRPTDNLHPVEEGYEIWASSVAPPLKSWIK